MKKSKYLIYILFLLLTGCEKRDLRPSWTDWTKYPGNPVLVPGSATDWDREFVGFGSVIYHGGKYHMWYSGGSFTSNLLIGHATSDDGIIWTKDINNPVLNPGPAGSWDENWIHLPSVLVINNTFHMWYTGHKGTNRSFDFQIGHATSSDGITWTKDPNNPVLTRGATGAWDYAWIAGPSVIYDGSKYHLWYGAYDGTNMIRFGHATSSDALTWTKDPSNPVLGRGYSTSWDYPRVDSPCVIFDGETFHMFYSGGNYFTWKIGYATSTDGSIWTKYASNPVLLPGQTGSWDSRAIMPMTVMDSSGVKYKMWYQGSKEENFGSIGYAEALPH